MSWNGSVKAQTRIKRSYYTLSWSFTLVINKMMHNVEITQIHFYFHSKLNLIIRKSFQMFFQVNCRSVSWMYIATELFMDSSFKFDNWEAAAGRAKLVSAETQVKVTDRPAEQNEIAAYSFNPNGSSPAPSGSLNQPVCLNVLITHWDGGWSIFSFRCSG